MDSQKEIESEFLSVGDLKNLKENDWVWIKADKQSGYAQVVKKYADGITFFTFYNFRRYLKYERYGTKWFAYKIKESPVKEFSEKLSELFCPECDYSGADVKETISALFNKMYGGGNNG